MTRHRVELQVATDTADLPSRHRLERWIDAALQDLGTGPATVGVRIVDERESRELNHAYRGTDRPTNVLSFPFEPPPGVPAEALQGQLGDLVLCAPVVAHEAAEQGKTREAHWAHMVIHGVLHLIGYDHHNDAEAAQMESREQDILRQLGYPDPYANDQDR